MLKVLSYILCDLDPKVKVKGQKAGICDGVPSTSALVQNKKVAKVRNRYNQVPHLTKDTTLESDKNTIKHHKQEPRGRSFKLPARKMHHC